MTDEQINAAIHAALGNPKGCPRCDSDECAYNKGLNYCTDLNAMHEAEKTIFPYYATVYANKLARATKADYSDDTEYFCATARQRAEAFLRTLGKYKATTEESSAVQKEVQL